MGFDLCVCVYFFDCGWALFGNRVAFLLLVRAKAQIKGNKYVCDFNKYGACVGLYSARQVPRGTFLGSKILERELIPTREKGKNAI